MLSRSALRWLALLIPALVPVVQAIEVQQVTLPSVNDVMTDLNLTAGEENELVFNDVAGPSQLVILARRDTTIPKSYFPVGRSYYSGDWEQVAGPNAELEWTCETGTCNVTVVPGADDRYFITSYALTLSDKEKAARFLEMVTFGPTTSLINDIIEATGDIAFKMAKFVEEQVNSSVSSHREYFRKRLNQRSLETYKYGVSGPRPCEENSRWRRFAFTSRDMAIGNKGYRVDITHVTDDTTTAYVLSYMGSVRTVLYEPLRYFVNFWSTTNNSTLELPPRDDFEFCKVEDIEGARRLPVSFFFQCSFI